MELPTEETNDVINRISAVPISAAEFMRYAERCRRHQETASVPIDPFLNQSLTAVSLAAGDRDKAAALWFRMRALARILKEPIDVGAGTFPDDVFASSILSEVAATEPIRRNAEGQFEFDREQVLRRLSELTESETRERWASR